MVCIQVKKYYNDIFDIENKNIEEIKRDPNRTKEIKEIEKSENAITEATKNISLAFTGVLQLGVLTVGMIFLFYKTFIAKNNSV
jgi:hypothetical protein